MTEEVQNWPYDFPASEDFQKSSQRGSVSGKLLVRDRYKTELPVQNLYTILHLLVNNVFFFFFAVLTMY